MKAFLLTAIALMAFAGSMFAQNFIPESNWEAGVNIGVSSFTRPLGLSSEYTGTRTNTVPDFSIRVNRFLNEHWMLGIDIGSRKWESYGTWQENGTLGQTLNSQQVSFLIASHAINESFELNYMLPFYNRFHSYNRANLYFGVMLGLMTTVNDGSMGYSKYKGNADSGATYLSSYDYGFGIGYNFGLQVGYTYYVLPQFGIGVELAARYAAVHTNNVSFDNQNTNFNLLYFPETISIRYRF